MTDEVDEAKEKTIELENDKKSLIAQINSMAAQAETQVVERRVLEEDINDLEREKMMLELELEENKSKNKVALRNLEMEKQTSKVSYSIAYRGQALKLNSFSFLGHWIWFTSAVRYAF